MENMTTELHVLPDNDSRKHLHSAECWCEPRRTEPMRPVKHPVYIHRASDGRELLDKNWHCLEVNRPTE
jgi:hypothetical protein